MRDSSGLVRPHSVSELDEDDVAEPLSSESDDALLRLLSCGSTSDTCSHKARLPL